VSFVLFFILATMAVVAAVMVIATKSPVSSALYLILVMCCLAGLFVLLGALFLAALQVIVYAGAIMVLFLFVIMLLNLRRDEFGRDTHIIQRYLGFILVAAILVQGLIIFGWAFKDYSATSSQTLESDVFADTLATDYSSAQWVARTLFTRFSYPFEVTSILLLAAIIGAVVIARRRRTTEIAGESPAQFRSREGN
jgi:NADH-quinone oxidoreductase subunit J